MNIQKLVKELDRNKLSASVEEQLLKFGDQAFDYLYQAVSNGELTDRQTANALHVLFVLTREHCYGRQCQLFELVKTKIMDSAEETRAEASVAAIYLTRIGERFPHLGIELYTKPDFIITMKEVLDQGIPEPACSYIKNYVSKYNSTYTLLLENKLLGTDLIAAEEVINSVKDEILSGGKSQKSFKNVIDIAIKYIGKCNIVLEVIESDKNWHSFFGKSIKKKLRNVFDSNNKFSWIRRDQYPALSG